MLEGRIFIKIFELVSRSVASVYVTRFCNSRIRTVNIPDLFKFKN